MATLNHSQLSLINRKYFTWNNFDIFHMKLSVNDWNLIQIESDRRKKNQLSTKKIGAEFSQNNVNNERIQFFHWNAYELRSFPKKSPKK